ncbi:CHAP domain-containing protein [Plantibacter sp. VKM Ac-2880]|uniref:CHAP domain-containing protein n=1 Tax=Plantibacter sp. VKM Ac-2880 TaxID=2783827 RepID=UPI00188EA5E0|nr:CHAP domain-containing protein [Plantibacter sp. VKM Ac-2880]
MTAAGASGPEQAETTPDVPLTRKQLRIQEQAAKQAEASSASSEPATTPVDAEQAEVDEHPEIVLDDAVVEETDTTETTGEIVLDDRPLTKPSAPAVTAPQSFTVSTTSGSPLATVAPLRTGAERVARKSKPTPAAAPAIAVRKPKPTGARPGSVRGVATMAFLVPALLATVALPAYAASSSAQTEYGTSASEQLKTSGAQSVVASDKVADAPLSRDLYTATTPDELAERQRKLDAAAAASEATYSITVGARQAGDDYPWFDQATDDEGGGLSPLRYYYRECVDFVAWRLNRDAGTPSGNWAFTWGNGLPPSSAYGWADSWQYNKGTNAIAGSVAWFNYNHVAYVQSVNADGTVTLEEYNWGSARHSYNTRTIAASAVALYLYPPGVG